MKQSNSFNWFISNSDLLFWNWLSNRIFYFIFIAGKTRTKDKYRVVYNDFQRLELEKEYHTSHYITIRRKSELANILHLSERQVKIWFQNRRAKDRKITKKGRDPTGAHPVFGGCPPMGLSMMGHPSMSGGSAITNGPMGYGLDIRPKLEPGLMAGPHSFGLPNNHHPHSGMPQFPPMG